MPLLLAGTFPGAPLDPGPQLAPGPGCQLCWGNKAGCQVAWEVCSLHYVGLSVECHSGTVREEGPHTLITRPGPSPPPVYFLSPTFP